MAFSNSHETESFLGNSNVHLKRRTGPQHESFGNGTYVTTGEDFSKAPQRRRNVCSLICYRIQRILCAKPLQGMDYVYYEDTFNDEPWRCRFGTNPEDGIWMNQSDKVGTIMSSMVWILMLYSVVTISLLAENGHLPKRIAMVHATICAMALASHAKTMFTDPGSVPPQAVPLPILFEKGITTHAMCSHCQTYKPPNSHHCRICNRCISGMDRKYFGTPTCFQPNWVLYDFNTNGYVAPLHKDHCPWMNNCVGAANLKHFILFLCYTWIGCTYVLILFAINYFFCSSEECVFSTVLVQLVRIMTVIGICTFLFVSSMLMNVTFGIMTGVGTIDRLKMKSEGTRNDSDAEPMKLKDVFGIQGYWTWVLPFDPIFEDHDRILKYSIPDRLRREHERAGV